MVDGQLVVAEFLQKRAAGFMARRLTPTFFLFPNPEIADGALGATGYGDVAVPAPV
jgi:hypothetical protein